MSGNNDNIKGAISAGMAELAGSLRRMAMAKAQGQSERAAFWSGFATSGFSVGTTMGGNGAGGFMLRTTLAGTISGTVSEQTGGKFANGAVTGAFQHMFNEEAVKSLTGTWSKSDTDRQNAMVKGLEKTLPNQRVYNMGNGEHSPIYNINSYGIKGATFGASLLSDYGLPGMCAGGTIGYAGGLVYGSAIESGLTQPMPDWIDYAPTPSIPNINK